MKTNIKILLLALAVTTFSCGEDFLELDPQQSISINNAIVDLNSLNASTLGVYNNLQDANVYGWDFPLIPDILSDNVFVSRQNAGRFLGYDEYNKTDQNGRAGAQWLDNYEIVVNASNIINRFPDANFLSTELPEANNRLGEAHALRALAYWNLVRFFARPYSDNGGASDGVALNNEGTTGTIITPGRETVGTVYQQIISDLEEAISLMTLTEDGRFSSEGAQAILAKVYLYMEDWSNAEANASAVISSGRYDLYADGDAWLASWGANFGSEDIFTVVNTPTDNLGVNSIGGIYDQDGYGDILASQDLYDIYSETDSRRDVMIPGDRVDGETDTFFPEGKYPNGETGQDYIKVMRLADIYLIRAEARARQNDEAGAREDLDAVASRVDPNYVASTASGQDLIDAIILERRKELAFEGDRVFDLMRTQQTWTKFRTFETQEVRFDDPQTINPIPRAETDLNPNMAQNVGY